jgi:hypothetical protein
MWKLFVSDVHRWREDQVGYTGPLQLADLRNLTSRRWVDVVMDIAVVEDERERVDIVLKDAVVEDTEVEDTEVVDIEVVFGV